MQGMEVASSYSETGSFLTAYRIKPQAEEGILLGCCSRGGEQEKPFRKQEKQRAVQVSRIAHFYPVNPAVQ